MEQLDHRQLLSVTFTGNVVTDFPESTSPGVVVLTPNPADPNFKIPNLAATPPAVANFIKVSGLTLEAIRVSYNAEQDTLSIGLQQPLNQKTGQRVIAGDTDNNLNGGTVDPLVTSFDPNFNDFYLLGGSETMYANIDLLANDVVGNPATMTDNVVAGIPFGFFDGSLTNPLPKYYQVAEYSSVGFRGGFGNFLPDFTGTSFLANTPSAPGFEMQIRRFSELYTMRTGQTFTPNRTVQVGAFASSLDDDGISEAQIPPLPFVVRDATMPPDICPVNPPVIINPHEGRHIDTAHRTVVRAYIFGTADFDVSQIDPASVRLNGAAPIRPPIIAQRNGDSHPDATYFFRGTDIDLPAGRVDARITGLLLDGTPFESTSQVFNKNASFYGNAVVSQQAAKLGSIGLSNASARLETQSNSPILAPVKVESSTMPTMTTPSQSTVSRPASFAARRNTLTAVPGSRRLLNTPVSGGSVRVTHAMGVASR